MGIASIPDRPKVWAINLGAGNQPYEGYTGFDWAGWAVDIRGDLSRLPFRDDSITEFFASHVVEHIPYYQVIDVLREINRALKPRDGLFWGYVPDGVVVAQRWLESVEKDDKNARNIWLANIYGGNTADKWQGPGQIHYCLYDQQLLYDVLTRGGFHPVVVAAQEVGPFDFRLVFMAGKGYYGMGNIWGTGGYPRTPWRKPIWEYQNSPVPPPPEGALY